MTRTLTTASRNYYKGGLIHDNIFQNNPFWYMLKTKGDGFRMGVDGGHEAQFNVIYEENGNFKFYNGFDLLDNTPQDGITAGKNAWCQASAANVISGLQKFQNRGKSRIVKVWREINKQTVATTAEQMNKAALNITRVDVTNGQVTDSQGTVALNSLPLLVQSNPEATGTLHGIAQNTQAWWRNREVESSATTTQQMYAELLKVHRLTKRGMYGAADCLFSDEVTRDLYIQHMDQKIRYDFTDTASVGFEAVKFLNAKWFDDVYAPGVVDNGGSGGSSQDGADGTDLNAGAVYFLNTKALSLLVAEGLDFAPQGAFKAERQDAIIEYLFWYGQLITPMRRKLGVLWNINPALTITGT